MLLLLLLSQAHASTVRLITIGPGDDFWSAFGHTAIAIDDEVYGFGYFSFDDDLVGSFLRNQMQYDLGVSDLAYEARLAAQQNRTFSMLELQLEPAVKQQLIAYLKWHNLPENQTYPYDYFLQNCATKVRDLINQASVGHLQQATQTQLQSSYLDATFPAPQQGLMNLGLAIGYGWSAYTKRSAWELMAFPVTLEQQVLQQLPGLVTSSPEVIYQAQPTPAWVAFWRSHWALITYVCLWTALLLWRRSRRTTAKGLLLLHSLIGWVLLALWLMTPHAVADHNFNVLLFMPLGFLLLKWAALKWLLYVCLLLWLTFALWLGAWYLLPLLLPVMLATFALTEVSWAQAKT